MARLACESKMAYYPTSVETLKKVKELFHFEDEAIIVDPCCGEGDALAVFKGCGKLYGIELDSLRAQKASSKLDVLLNADATLGVRRSLNWASFLFLNPPYGVDSLQKRLEEKFVYVWGNTVIKGGYMLLVINPSSATEEMAKTIRLANYKPLVTFFDPANEDYQKYHQFFILFQRQDYLYRHSLEGVLESLDIDKAIDISEIKENFSVCSGREPNMFKEIDFPTWKLDKLLEKSTILSEFEKELLTAECGSFGSIEELNEGQRQFLTASGAIDEPIKENESDLGLILKGTVKKIVSQSTNVDDNGNIKSGKYAENFVTEVYGLDLNTLKFYRYT
jgi:hypothetical protein